jgi:serine/threonine-protein kinase
MGEVYEARHARLAGRYAVKIIRHEIAGQSPLAIQRFQREAEVTSALRHPNIVQIIDFNQTPEGAPYIVMEYLEGSDLDSRMAQRGPMPLTEVVPIVEQIASALAAAHGHGVIHRDLKPQNVLLVPIPVALPGQPTEFIKVVDFGISKFKMAESLTGQPVIMGTPHYMSPEQARGQGEDIDGRTDQFALAIMTYELLSGRKPFPGDTVAGVIYNVVHETPPSLTPMVGEAVDAVLRTALAKDRASRFPTIAVYASSLRAAASRVLRDGSVQAHSHGHGHGQGQGGDDRSGGGGRSLRRGTFETGGGASFEPAFGNFQPEMAVARSRRRRRVGVGVALALVVAAGAGLVIKQRLPLGGLTSSEPQAARAAEAARAALEVAVAAEKRGLEASVQAAAAIPELRNAAASRIDAFTFADLFETEDWWQRHRELTAVVFDRARPLATRRAADVGSPEAWTFWRNEESKVASAVLLGSARAYLAAGVGFGPKGEFGLVLAKPLDEQMLGTLASRAKAKALLVSDGKRSLGSSAAAADPAGAGLAGLVGQESQPAVVLPEGRVAAPARVGSGIWLWTVVGMQ